MRKILSSLALLWGLSAAPALAANPELLAHIQGIDDPARESRALQISSLALDADVVGALAELTLTARFENPTERVMEGEFSFELPAGAVVTGYALDIEGQMVDGVLLDPLRAERTYEAQVRKGIDPGVANVSRGNVFSTRIFPIPQVGSRTIRLKFAAPVHPQRGLVFPLSTAAAVGELAVSVRAFSLTEDPVLTLPNAMPFEWRRGSEGSTAVARLGAVPLAGEFRLAPVHTKLPALSSRHSNGERRVHIIDSTERANTRRTTGGSRLRVYWDRSLSRGGQALGDEQALLQKFIAQSKPASIDLVLFNSSGASVQRLAAQDLGAALGAVAYRGATSFEVLGNLDAPQADQCLVFSDGVVTIDSRPDFRPGCEVFAITSAADADTGFLRRLTGDPSAVLQTGSRSENEILARLAGGGPRVVQARGEDGRALRFVTLDAGPSGWSVITEQPVSGGIILGIAGLGDDVVERLYSPAGARKAHFDGAGALWAADRVGLLAAEDGAHADFVALSRRFSVATPGLSFLVLEDPQDYVAAELAPPSNYPKESLAEYRELKTEYDAGMREAKDGRLDVVLERWHDVVKWWKTDFDPKAERKAAPPAFSAAPRRGGSGGGGNEEMAEVVVTGMRASRSASMAVRRSVVGIATPDIDIQMEEWNVARPYLQALDAAAPADFEAVFAEQERQYGQLPAFYFDVAEWLFRRQAATVAAREMLLSAIELPVSNEETAFMVAERLQRYDDMDRAVWLYERAAEQTDYLPQPRRSLALALVKRAGSRSDKQARADLQRAVRLLTEVVMTPWPSSFDGIEVVALMEINRLLPRLESLDVRASLDWRLRARLDVDLRVVIEWNTAASDMDLWVDQPDGERAIYNNPLTAIGGRLSNDMTEGFGPEEYLLHHAIGGRYRISVNVYAADRINPNGSTVVTARLFRNYGRANQAEQTMEVELHKADKGEKLIGTFEVQ